MAFKPSTSTPTLTQSPAEVQDTASNAAGGLVAASPGDATVTAGDADWACADIAGTATNANPRPPNQNSPTTHRIRGRGPGEHG